jgi:protein MpaA
MAVSADELGPLKYKSRIYGYSSKNIPLEIYEPLTAHAHILIIGSIHGDESMGTVLLSECLRAFTQNELTASVILSANPDGILAGTRCNARGVDLNRNFPAKNWSADPVYYRNRPGDTQNIALSPGETGGSEPETGSLISLIEAQNPKLIVSLHGFLACIDDPDASPIAKDLAMRTNMEVVPDVGYSTPGSFGSWCAEKRIPIITYEFPAINITELKRNHNPVLKDLMTGYYDSML